MPTRKQNLEKTLEITKETIKQLDKNYIQVGKLRKVIKLKLNCTESTAKDYIQTQVEKGNLERTGFLIQLQEDEGSECQHERRDRNL